MLFWKRSFLKNSPWVQFCRDFKGIYSPIVWPLAADDISPQRWVPSRTYAVGSNVVSISKILTDQFFDPPTTCGFIWWVMVLAVVLGSTFKLDRKKRNYCWTKIYATGDWKPRPLDAYLMNRSFTLLDKIYWHALQLICDFFLVFNSVWKENFSHPPQSAVISSYGTLYTLPSHNSHATEICNRNHVRQHRALCALPFFQPFSSW